MGDRHPACYHLWKCSARTGITPERIAAYTEDIAEAVASCGVRGCDSYDRDVVDPRMVLLEHTQHVRGDVPSTMSTVYDELSDPADVGYRVDSVSKTQRCGNGGRLIPRW